MQPRLSGLSLARSIARAAAWGPVGAGGECLPQWTGRVVKCAACAGSSVPHRVFSASGVRSVCSMSPDVSCVNGVSNVQLFKNNHHIKHIAK